MDEYIWQYIPNSECTKLPMQLYAAMQPKNYIQV